MQSARLCGAVVLGVGLVLALAAWPGRAHADDARTLKGHTFPKPVSDDGAFLPTSVGFRQGVLFLNAGSLTVLGQKKSFDKVAALESLDVTVNAIDWLALNATADMQALLGASEVGLYGSANQVAGSLRFGPALRALRLSSTGTQITFRPYYQATFGAIVDVSGVLPTLSERLVSEAGAPPTTAVNALARAQALETQLLKSAVTPLQRSAWGGSLHLAQAITPQLGVQVSYGLKRERFVATPYDINVGVLPRVYFVSVTHVATASVSFDAKDWHVPLVLLAELVVAGGTLSAEADDRSNSFDTTVLTGAGLYYSGRPTLQVGAHFAAEHGLSAYTTPFGRTDDPTAYYGQFSMRYFFDSTEPKGAEPVKAP